MILLCVLGVSVANDKSLLLLDQIRDERLLFLQFIFRRGDFRLAEFVERHALCLLYTSDAADE